MKAPLLPSVSVCVPSYCGAAYLPESLRSVARQEGVRLQVVVLDDHSPDSSHEVAQRVAEEYPAVDWIIERHVQQKGMVENWNACLQYCTGDYIKVMGQDDVLFPGCLQKQAQVFSQHPEIALCAADCCIVSRRGKPLFHRRKGWPTGLLSAEAVRKRCFTRACNPLGEPVAVMARREDYQADGGFDTTLRYFVDVEKCLRIMGNRPAWFFAEPLAGFRVHRNAASFRLQGDAYREFLTLEQNFCTFSLPPGTRRWRFLQASLDSLLRLIFYRFWG